MDTRFFSRFTLYSFVALLISWIVSSLVVALISGIFIFKELVSYAVLVFSFILIAWSVFIFPLMYFINRLLLIQVLRAYFPLIAMLYGVFVYALFFSIIVSPALMWSTLFTQPLAASAGLIGGLWGLIYEVFYVYERRRNFVN